MTIPAAQPLVFGEGNALLGWYHGPAAANARDLGVVICAPHGYGSLCVHWGLRLLAERLAAHGLPTVRFDYHGTGDSLGDDRLPGRVPAWLESIRSAIALLEEKSGVTRVALVGLRLGATLAAVAASDRSDVDALVMYGPSFSGRTYVREQKALGLTRRDGDPVDDTGNPNDVLMAGWLISEETANALGKIDVAKFDRMPVKDVLILHREDFPIDERPQKQLTLLGANVTAAKTQDWLAFMQDAVMSKEPRRDFDTIVAWLTARATGQRTAPVVAPVPAGRIDGPTFFEEPTLFSNEPLFGVLCIPKAPAPDQPLLVFLNTGANHHIGPHRTWVEMARRLSAKGIASFRFDSSGLGDSPPRSGSPHNVVYSMGGTRDVAAAIDFLHSRGFHNVTLSGLCSGAYLAFHTAVKDPRVRGIVIINLQRFLWKEGDSLEISYRNSVPPAGTYVQRALRLDTWKRLGEGTVNVRLIGSVLASRAIEGLKKRASEAVARVLGPSFEVNEVARGFLGMLERGTRVLLLYGKSDSGVDELALHLGPEMRRLKGKPNAELAYFVEADHTLTTMAARDALLEQLTRVVQPSR